MVAMATPLNLELLASMGFTVGDDAAPNDLVVAVRAVDDATLAAAITDIDVALTARIAAAGDSGGEAPARTIASAVRRVGPGLALISVPGPARVRRGDRRPRGGLRRDDLQRQRAGRAGGRAQAARRRTRPSGDGARLRHRGGRRRRPRLRERRPTRPGRHRGRIRDGRPAAAVPARRAPASASAACLGRRRPRPVGGRRRRSTRAALDALDADPATELIVVVSKPAGRRGRRGGARARRDAQHARPVRLARARRAGSDRRGRARCCTTLGSAGADLAELAPGRPPETRVGSLRGLFAGGTLCDEAMLIATDRARPDPLEHPAATRTGASIRTATADGHLMIDFGDDELTVGRPHPMIDASLRLRPAGAEAADPTTAVVLLDVVLGYGAHPDPAAELAPAIAAATTVPVVVALIGTEPTRRASNARPQHAARRRRGRLRLERRRRPLRRLARGWPVMTICCAASRGSSPPASTCSPTRCATRRWPVTRGRLAPADGRHRRPTWPRARRSAPAAANELGGRRGCSASTAPARRRGARPRRRSGSGRRDFLHAGPPIDWERASGPMRGALIGRGAVRGPGRRRRARPRRCSRPAAASRSTRATTTTRSGRWPASISASMWMFVLEDPATGAARLLLAQRGPGQGAALRRVSDPR